MREPIRYKNLWTTMSGSITWVSEFSGRWWTEWPSREILRNEDGRKRGFEETD